MPSYLTAAELDAVQTLHRRTPYAITGISQGVFSLARHYGQMKYGGDTYYYMPAADECVRADVWKFVEQLRKKANPPRPVDQSSLEL